MNLPGYDEWKLRGPDEGEPTCDYCGNWPDLRVMNGDTLICEDCYVVPEGGHAEPCFDDLPTAAEAGQDKADAEADYRYEQMRDRQMGG